MKLDNAVVLTFLCHFVPSALYSQAVCWSGTRWQSPTAFRVHVLLRQRHEYWMSKQEAHTVPSFCRRPVRTFSKIRSWHGWTCWTLHPLSSQRCCSRVFRCQRGSWQLKELQVILAAWGFPSQKESQSSTAAAFTFSSYRINVYYLHFADVLSDLTCLLL